MHCWQDKPPWFILRGSWGVIQCGEKLLYMHMSVCVPASTTPSSYLFHTVSHLSIYLFFALSFHPTVFHLHKNTIFPILSHTLSFWVAYFLRDVLKCLKCVVYFASYLTFYGHFNLSAGDILCFRNMLLNRMGCTELVQVRLFFPQL